MLNCWALAVFYKGAGFGRKYALADARATGIDPHNPEIPYDLDALVRHVGFGTVASPFVSISRSYGVALAYARMGKVLASEQCPGIVYEIVIETDDREVKIIDPVLEIASRLPLPGGSVSYQHDGMQATLMALVDPAHEHFLQWKTPQPPPSGGPRRSVHVSMELTAMVRAMRDAEVVVCGRIPKRCVRNRFEVWDTKARIC